MELTFDGRQDKKIAAAAYKVMRYHPERGAEGVMQECARRGIEVNKPTAFDALLDAAELIKTQQDEVIGK